MEKCSFVRLDIILACLSSTGISTSLMFRQSLKDGLDRFNIYYLSDEYVS